MSLNQYGKYAFGSLLFRLLCLSGLSCVLDFARVSNISNISSSTGILYLFVTHISSSSHNDHTKNHIRRITLRFVGLHTESTWKANNLKPYFFNW